MVLEDVTREVTDAESNAENQKSSLSGTTARRGISPSRRSTVITCHCTFLSPDVLIVSQRQDTKSFRETTDDETSISLASTLPCRRRSRSDPEVVRRLSTEKPKRRRESQSIVDDRPIENASSRSKAFPSCDVVRSDMTRCSLMDVLATVREDERTFPDGYAFVQS